MTGALVRLATMFSPAFPVGGFAYSAGLERAVADRVVVDGEGLRRWMAALLAHGSARNDAILFAEAFRRAAKGASADDLHDLALALAGTAERHAESAGQGAAFADASSGWLADSSAGARAYAVAAGDAAGRSGATLDQALALFLAASAGNLVQAAIRLSVVGQSGGVAVLMQLEAPLASLIAFAAGSSLDDLGGCAVIAEVASMNHETQETRLFRS